MASHRIAKATEALGRLDRQAVSLERLDVLARKGARLAEAGITFADIAAKQAEINALADDGVQYDFNDALNLLYDESFGPSTLKEEG